MLWVTERIESCHTDLPSDLNDGSQRLGGIAHSPGILRQHIAGSRLLWCVETQACASQQPTVAA